MCTICSTFFSKKEINNCSRSSTKLIDLITKQLITCSSTRHRLPYKSVRPYLIPNRAG